MQSDRTAKYLDFLKKRSFSWTFEYNSGQQGRARLNGVVSFLAQRLLAFCCRILSESGKKRNVKKKGCQVCEKKKVNF